MCVYMYIYVGQHTWRPEGNLRCQVSPSSLFIAVCSGLADLLVSGDSSVPTSPLEGGLVDSCAILTRVLFGSVDPRSRPEHAR